MPDRPDIPGGISGTETKTEQEPVFYYSRARRLEKASEAVRRLNDPTPQPRVGLFRTLVATKSRAMVFISIMLICGAALVMSLFNSGEVTLAGNSIAFSALYYGDATYVAIKKAVQKEGAYTGIVDVGISFPLTAGEEKQGLQAPVEVQRIFFTLNSQEDFRISVPFTPAELLIMMRAGEEQITARIKPQ